MGLGTVQPGRSCPDEVTKLVSKMEERRWMEATVSFSAGTTEDGADAEGHCPER